MVRLQILDVSDHNNKSGDGNFGKHEQDLIGGAPTPNLPVNPTQMPGPPTVEGSKSARDFSSAIDLIKEASEAIRINEERAVDLELQLEQVTSRSAEQIKAFEAQIATLERRLAKSEERSRVAEARASEAEAWLARLHDAITTSFRRAAPPDEMNE